MRILLNELADSLFRLLNILKIPGTGQLGIATGMPEIKDFRSFERF